MRDVTENSICVRCGKDYGDHRAKFPHMNMPWNPPCGGFSLSGERTNSIIIPFERSELSLDAQRVWLDKRLN